jgi:hypothetical protein
LDEPYKKFRQAYAAWKDTVGKTLTSTNPEHVVVLATFHHHGILY